MAAVDATAVSQEELEAKAWDGFTEGNWQKDIDVRDFIQKNYTPYEGFSPIARLRPSRTSSATTAASRNPHRYPPVGPINMPIPPRMPETIGKPIAPSAR